MKIENISVMNFDGAFHGMRNPKNSWKLSDSIFRMYDMSDDSFYDDVHKITDLWIPDRDCYGDENEEAILMAEYDECYEWLSQNSILSSDEHYANCAIIGPKDMKLAQTLCNAGPEHRKFLRQIFVSMDITAPLYWWKEADTYKVATVANSTSTMHKIASKPINDLSNFEIDDYDCDLQLIDPQILSIRVSSFLDDLEQLRQLHLQYAEEAKNARTPGVKQKCEQLSKAYWKELIRWLPESWLQTRTWTANYETLRSIYGQRHNHKLTEWHTFCDTIEKLPYANELIVQR